MLGSDLREPLAIGKRWGAQGSLVGQGGKGSLVWRPGQRCLGEALQGEGQRHPSCPDCHLHPSRSHAFAFQGSAASCCPVSCPQPRVQSGTWAAWAWGPRWGACVGVLSRPHILLGPFFRTYTSRGGQVSPSSKYL